MFSIVCLAGGLVMQESVGVYVSLFSCKGTPVVVKLTIAQCRGLLCF